METSIRSICTQARRDIITMTAKAGCGHPGGSLSIVEALVALYFEKMNIDPQNPKMPNRDRFVLSKGHAAPALYGVLAARGFFSRDEIANFRQLGSFLQGHPDMKRCPGVMLPLVLWVRAFRLLPAWRWLPKPRTLAYRFTPLSATANLRKVWFGRQL